MLFSAFRPARTKSEDRSQDQARPQAPSPPKAAGSFSWRRKSTSFPAASSSSKDGDEEPDLGEINSALRALAEIFPDVRPDVFREMLIGLSNESRVHIVADQLLRSGAQWIRGRWRVTSKVSSANILREALETDRKEPEEPRDLVPQEETFRSEGYKRAVRTALKDEFQSVSRSAIEGVLVEQNYSYTNSRPILTGLAAKSWRLSLKSMMRWRRPTSTSHFMFMQPKSVTGDFTAIPQLKQTGSVELDQELHETVLKPLIDEDNARSERTGWELAKHLNAEEANSNQATFECECCFDDVTFESVAFCSTGEHQLCFGCLQNTVSAALYSQSWAKSIDHERSQVTCFAPSSNPCSGCIPNSLAKRAVLQTRGGEKTWAKLEQRLAEDAMHASDGHFLHCPFCTYAEVDDVIYPPGIPYYRLKKIDNLSHLFLLLVVLFWTISFCWQYFWLSLLFPLPQLRSNFALAFKSLARKNCLSPRFLCRNPTCSRASCRLCKGAWRDPHKCNEREEVSLRTTVEAARTAAMKRVCPKCKTPFVKESGCNKMTCTCGYTMCYLCRQGLGQQPKGLTNPHQDHDYSHFCGHFRALPGRCSQCNKCDLYREENQDEVVRRAGEAAEKDWREKMRKKTGSEQCELDETNRYEKGLEGTLQRIADYLVETYVTC